MEEKQENLILCTEHKGFEKNMVCYDPSCQLEGMFCVKCVISKHRNCDSNYLLLAQDMADSISFINKEEEIRERIGIIYDKAIDNITETLTKQKERAIQSLSGKAVEVPSKKLFLNVDKLNHVKQAYSISFNEETEKLEISTKEKERLEERFSNFKDKIDKLVYGFDSTVKECFLMDNKLKKGKASSLFLDKANWLYSNSISIEQRDNSLLFTRIGAERASGLFSAIYRLPLTKPSSFQLTVQDLNIKDRFIGFGLLGDEELVFAMQNSYSSLLQHKTILYHFGYGHVMWGDKENNLEKTEGLSPNSTIKLIFSYTEEEGYALSLSSAKEIVNSTLGRGRTRFYLFLILKHYESKVKVEQLS